MRGVDLVTTKERLASRVERFTVIGRTVNQVTLQILAEAHVGRPQSIVQLGEATAVVPVAEVAHDSSHKLLHVGESVVQSIVLVLVDEFLEDFCLSGIGLAGLVFHLLDDGAGSFVSELQAAAQVDNLSGEAGI